MTITQREPAVIGFPWCHTNRSAHGREISHVLKKKSKMCTAQKPYRSDLNKTNQVQRFTNPHKKITDSVLCVSGGGGWGGNAPRKQMSPGRMG